MLRRIVRSLRRRWFQARWRFVGRFGHRPGPLPGGIRVGAVLLSYGRPGNIDRILTSLLRGSLIDRVILSNDDPSISIKDFVSHSDDRLTILDQTENRGPGMRWRLAHELLADVDVVVSIDDDLFLFPRQIERLVSHAAESPAMPHGVIGGRGSEIIERRESSVDVLWRAYAVTAEHVERYMEIVSGIGEHGEYVERFADDVVISLTGDAPPQVHPVGRLLSCRSSADPGIALHQQAGFFEARRVVRAEAINVRAQCSWWPSDADAI